MEKHGSESYFVVGEGLLAESGDGRRAGDRLGRAAVPLLAAWARRAPGASSASPTARSSAR